MQASSPPPTGTVTFLFTDVEASTRKWEDHPDEMRRAMARHDELMQSAIAAHQGTVFTTAGDSFCAAFASPRSALDAAIQAQRAFVNETWGEVAPFRVRMALHSGNADERDGDYFGPPLNRCARLLSTSHGAQIVASVATRHLLADSLPEDVTLIDLGAHQLKDLDRAEHVFQIAHPDLPQQFPPLRSGGPVADAADRLVEARQAYARNQWKEAFGAYEKAAERIELDAEDLARFGEAAWWAGKSDEGIRLREAAYATFLREGKERHAARLALKLAETFAHRLATAVARGWLARAKRLLAQREQSVEHGYLLRLEAIWAFDGDGDAERALALAEEVQEIGAKFGDANLEALGIQDRGRILVAMGRIEEGMQLMDEAMAAAVGGELDAETTGRSYCNMLSVCDNVADFQRAGEWVEATAAWAENHSDSAYPGICRIYGAEVKWLRGAWDAAAEEVRRAMEELSGFDDIIGIAWYQLGEIELRAGNLDAAEEMFRTAHENGKMPIPGMARLYLMRDDAEAAVELLGDALQPGRLGPPARARLLPTWIEAKLALGDVAGARESIEELQQTRDITGSATLGAATLRAKGAIALAEDRPDEAVDDLQSAVREWTNLKMPYEAADTRLLLAGAHSAAGNKTAARLEADAAQATFDRLGATGDAERAGATG